MGDSDVHRRPASKWNRSTDADERSHEWRGLPGFVEQCLAPILKRRDIVVIDNVSFHKVAGVQEAIEAARASLRYLPQYSPDLNPIELVFHPLKTRLRKAAERTVAGLQRGVRSFIRALDPSECMSYFRHAGYEPL
jgi:transposase